MCHSSPAVRAQTISLQYPLNTPYQIMVAHKYPNPTQFSSHDQGSTGNGFYRQVMARARFHLKKSPNAAFSPFGSILTYSSPILGCLCSRFYLVMLQVSSQCNEVAKQPYQEFLSLADSSSRCAGELRKEMSYVCEDIFSQVCDVLYGV